MMWMFPARKYRLYKVTLPLLFVPLLISIVLARYHIISTDIFYLSLAILGGIALYIGGWLQGWHGRVLHTILEKGSELDKEERQQADPVNILGSSKSLAES